MPACGCPPQVCIRKLAWEQSPEVFHPLVPCPDGHSRQKPGPGSSVGAQKQGAAEA